MGSFQSPHRVPGGGVVCPHFLLGDVDGCGAMRNKPRAYKSAMILFGLQIPIVSIPEFSYQFYTGLLFLVSFSSPANIGVEFHAASKIGVGIASGAEDVLVGINVIAVAALMWLIHVFPRRNARVAAT